MWPFIVRRTIYSLITLLILSFTIFTVVRLTGDPAVLLAEPGARAEDLERMREQWGLNRPWPLQYLSFLQNVSTGEFGKSFNYRLPVSELYFQRLPNSLQLALVATVISLVIGVPAGLLSAVRVNGVWDNIGKVLGLLGLSIPGFWLGLVLIYIFAVRWKVLPPSGFIPFTQDPIANLRSMVLPSFALGVYLAGPLARFIRSSLIEVLQTQYVMTARAKGLHESRVMRSHALKNALIPTITFAGLQVGGLLGGAIVTEVVFSLPGTGSLALNGILNRDLPVVQGVVLIVACGYVLINIGVDIVYVLLDPRIKFADAR